MLLAALVLAGCGSESENAEPAADAEPATTEEAEEEESRCEPVLCDQRSVEVARERLDIARELGGERQQACVIGDRSAGSRTKVPARRATSRVISCGPGSRHTGPRTRVCGV